MALTLPLSTPTGTWAVNRQRPPPQKPCGAPGLPQVSALPLTLAWLPGLFSVELLTRSICGWEICRELVFYVTHGVLGHWTVLWGVREKEPQLGKLFPCPSGPCRAVLTAEPILGGAAGHSPGCCSAACPEGLPGASDAPQLEVTLHSEDLQFVLAMATVVTEKLSRLFINVRQLPQLLGPLSPGTVSSAEVPPVFWKPYIHGGYRPVRQTWRYYFSTLFQQHNEAINVWSHLAAALALLLRSQQLRQRVDFGQDEHARPLLIILAASVTYLTFSSLAHLLQAKSEFWHYSFFFMDYVGVAVYQYGSALGHFYYAIEPGWHRRVRGFFLPLAAALAWLSCAGSCYAKFRFHPRSALPGRLCQELPSALAYLLDISPVLHRIGCAARPEPALLYHKGQVLFFLLGAFFFSHPYPEKWFPGKCHFFGQSHQIFHVFLVLCTLAQIEAVVLDYESRREIYSSLQGDLAHDFSALFLLTVACSVLTAAYMARRVKNKLKEE
uniref:Progestin and adipoQ receptor family member 7 n=1 Tax=Ficedula albicollis TaxID=59894 RepID=A0A803V6H9_FICAL